MPGQVSLKEIEDMLEDCAPGAVIIAKVHHNWVIWSGRTYRGLPRGKHGTRRNPEIQAGHVKRMARFFDILPCAQSWIPALG
jgi:hypothetical protein